MGTTQAVHKATLHNVVAGGRVHTSGHALAHVLTVLGDLVAG